MRFSTDTRNDCDQCVRDYAPWWHNFCFQGCLTNQYGEHPGHAKGIPWKLPCGFDKFARSARMMIRPAN